MCPEVRELSAVAAVLHSADWDPRIRRRDAIDEDAAGVQIAGKLAGSIHVACPKIATKSELTCVRILNSRFKIGHASDCRHRAEGFIIESGHALGDSAQYCGRVEGAWPIKWSSSAENASP